MLEVDPRVVVRRASGGSCWWLPARAMLLGLAAAMSGRVAVGAGVGLAAVPVLLSLLQALRGNGHD